MKKILLTIFSIFAYLLTISETQAFVRYEEKNPKQKIEMKMAGFINYAPFGWYEKDNYMWTRGFYTAFTPIIDIFSKDANVEINKNFYARDIEEIVQKIRSGELDFFVGAYNETEIFKGLHLLYPAVLYNPITVFMLPNRINEIKSTEDLKKLKGVRNTQELFSDYVDKKIKEYNVVEVDSAYSAFEKLYTREADYMISSYYNGMIEAIKLGLRYQIAPAKQTLWRIPMFIGVSKTSHYREKISRRITKYLTDKENIRSVEKYMQKLINDISQRYEGVVPPTFVKQDNPNENKDNQ